MTVHTVHILLCPRCDFVRFALLSVLNVFVVLFQLFSNSHEFSKDFRHLLFQGIRWVVSMRHSSLHGELRRSSNSSHHIFTLSIQQVFSVEMVISIGRIPGESNSTSTIQTHIAKDHSLNVTSCSSNFRDVMKFSIGLGTWIRPTFEDCTDGTPELNLWIRRKFFTQLHEDTSLKISHQSLQIFHL